MEVSKDKAISLGNEMADKLLELLKSNNIRNPVSSPLYSRLSKDWELHEKKLRDTLVEMVWLSHCAT